MPRFSTTKAAVVLLFIIACFSALTVRVAYLQTYFRQQRIQLMDDQQHTVRPIQARRGSIYDANGHPLATTVQTNAVYIDPKFVLKQYQESDGQPEPRRHRPTTRPGRPHRNLNQMDQDLGKLAKLLELDEDALVKLIGERLDARYIRIAENKDDATAAEVLKLNIPGVGVEPMCVRYYPMGAIASHVLGCVGKEGLGLDGLEMKFDRELAGKNGFKRLAKDARKRPIGVEADDYVPPLHGQHLVLTIDANIQMLAEQELTRAVEKFKAEAGEVIIMDPRTGDILAMANCPTFNPQNLEDSAPELRLNRAVVVPYEPGSTFKPFIAGPALMWHITRWDEVWPIPGKTWVAPYGRRVGDVHHYGPLCTWDVLVKSSNIGMSMMANRMGNPRLHEALTLFRFGQRTGVDLPGEDEGRVHTLRKWTRYSTESVAQGYEVMVTPLQMCRAFCVYANGGRLVKPRVVKGKLDADGNIIERNPSPRLEDLPQVIDAATTAQMRQILSDVLVRGTGTRAHSQYWNYFGKTGTSHISQGRAGYASNLYNSSFMAGAPLENPRVVVMMVIHKPDRALGYYGGTVSGPPAGRLLERVLGYMQIPESPALPQPPANITRVMHNYQPKLYASDGPTASAEH